MKKVTREDFIKKAKAVHGEKYLYDKAVYVYAKEKLIVSCRTHGDFQVSPNNHVDKSVGCAKCGSEVMANKQRKTVEQFVEEANEIHSYFYSYGKVIYKTARKPVVITCLEHGDFAQLPTNHLKGIGCPSCNGGMFNPSKRTTLYYLKVNDGQAYKFGITCKEIKARFLPIDRLKFEVLHTLTFSSGLDAYKAEQHLLNVYKAYKYTGPDLLTSGNTELVTKALTLEQITQTLKEL